MQIVELAVWGEMVCDLMFNLHINETYKMVLDLLYMQYPTALLLHWYYMYSEVAVVFL